MLANSKFLRNFGAMGGAQIVIRASRLVTTIMLSRLLVPEDFGLAAIVLTCYEFIALFTRNGIAAKVVQASESDVQTVAMTAYRMTWIVCLCLMLVQILAAWPIAWAYHEPKLVWPIAAMSLVYLATPVSNIQAAFQQREGKLGRIAMAGAAQVTVDNFLAAALAYSGFGLWAIILPKILVAPIWAIPVRMGHPWRPKLIEGQSRFWGWRDIARFSLSVMGVELLTTTQSNMDNLIVGYFLGLQALGIYYFAFNAGLGISLGFISAVAASAYPHLCEVKSDAAQLSARVKGTTKLIMMTLVPMIVLQASLATIYVPLVFGEKWSPAIPVLSLICLSALARPFAAIASQALRAIGRPEVELKWQVATTLLLGTALVIGAQFNLVWVAASVFVVQTLMLLGFVIAVVRQLTAPERQLPQTQGVSYVA